MQMLFGFVKTRQESSEKTVLKTHLVFTEV